MVFDFMIDFEEPVFVFGTTDPVQLIVNNSMLFNPLPLKLVCVDGFLYLYRRETSGFWKKEKLFRVIRKAKRPVRYVDDCKDASSECKVCLSNKVCVLTQPCNHVGLCNLCCLRIFKTAFVKKSGGFELSKPMTPQTCPFCLTLITNMMYVFVV